MDKDEGKAGEEASYMAQMALLKAGCRAAPWACREWLSLAPQCKPEDVIQAVHNVIHKVQRGANDWTLEHSVAAVTAGAVLLRGWKL